jgi:hypothetical protein
VGPLEGRASLEEILEVGIQEVEVLAFLGKSRMVVV